MDRCLHWGPILGVTLTNFVIATTLYFLFQWQYPLYSVIHFANYFVFVYLAISALYSYFSAVLIGPGRVPLGWKPEKKGDEKKLQFCHKCEGFKAPRSHHCSRCDRCILKMDHHCPWLNNCVGHANHRHFINFLLSAVIGSAHAFTLLGMTLYRALYNIPNVRHRYIYVNVQGFFCIIMSMGLSVGVLVGVGALLILQMKYAFKNMTSIEEWIYSKAVKRDREDVFVYPYHLGYWKNFKMLFWNEIGDGLHWDVADGCDQYTLTVEQLEQKKEKRQNSQLCRVVEPYNGRYFPLFSKGWRTCVSYPFNFDSRLAIDIDDEVMVTHYQGKWLFGHKMSDHPAKRRKGWFPHSCVVLIVEPEQCPEHSKKEQ